MRADPRPAVHPDSPNDDGRSGPFGPEQGRGGLQAHGPVRAAAAAHGRLVCLPGQRESRTVGR